MGANEISTKIYEIFKENLDDCLKNHDILYCSDDGRLEEYADKISNNPIFKDEEFQDEEFQHIIDDIKNLNKIYAAAVKRLSTDASVEQIQNAILEEKENWITKVLEEYFEKWIFPGSEITYPYFIDKPQKGMSKELFDSIKELGKKINVLLKTEIKAAETERDNYRNNHPHDYQIYSTTITNGKNFPEVLENVAKALKDKLDDFLKNNESIKAILKRMDNDKDNVWKDTTNKWKKWQKLVHELRKRQEESNIICGDQDDDCINTIIGFMEVCGIGIDCSGFVSRALATIFNYLQKDFDTQKKSLGGKKNRVKTNNSHYVSDYYYTFENETEGKKYDVIFTKDNCVKPRYLRPGDIICNEGHVKIISKVKDREKLIFETMESSAGQTTNTNVKKLMDGVKRQDLTITSSGEEPIIIISDKKYVAIRVPIMKVYYNSKEDFFNKEQISFDYKKNIF